MAEQTPARRHQRPDGVTDTEVEALGKLSEAWETTIRARGHLYSFHQLTGHADLLLDEAVELLHRAGQHTVAELVDSEIVGRNVTDGRWTFQVVEEYDEDYYTPFARIEARIRREITHDRTHVFEAEMKERRRTRTNPHHTAGPS